MPDSLFAVPWTVQAADCHWYHTTDIPGHGSVEGHWDLREQTDAYLGGVAFSGKRVLEVGPASGYLTVEMEKRGAQVVALEVLDDPGWDFVPFPPAVLNPVLGPRRIGTGSEIGVLVHPFPRTALTHSYCTLTLTLSPTPSAGLTSR